MLCLRDMAKAEENFIKTMEQHFSDILKDQKALAVAVSGGPDSLALMDLLYHWAAERKIEIHALTVDHGLRPEAKAEAEKVDAMCRSYSNLSHQILEWKPKEKPISRVQENAREARYKLISTYMQAHKIKYLFLGHHMDDQAETFLFRLAKGSGLKGLSCMSSMQDLDSGITLCRPLLDVQKNNLIEYCKEKKLDFINDPSNESEDFARVRLRKSMTILEKEGFSAKRLSKTVQRLERAENALDQIAKKIFHNSILETETSRAVLNYDLLKKQPLEIGFRVLLMTMEQLGGKGKAYAPRMEKTEKLFDDMMKPDAFRKRTLGGIIFERKGKEGQKTIVLTRER